MSAELPTHIRALVEEYREPLGLDRWSIRVAVKAIEESGDYAQCEAMAEYREADLYFDLDKFRTGDDPEEIVAHELSHCLVGPLHDEAQDLADTIAAALPDPLRMPLIAKLTKELDRAAERVTTDVGHAMLRYHRRLREARAEVQALRKDLKEARKQAPAA